MKHTFSCFLQKAECKHTEHLFDAVIESVMNSVENQEGLT